MVCAAILYGGLVQPPHTNLRRIVYQAVTVVTIGACSGPALGIVTYLTSLVTVFLGETPVFTRRSRKFNPRVAGSSVHRGQEVAAMVFDEGWVGNWPAEAEEEMGEMGGPRGGEEISLWEAELTALWEAEAAGRFVGFGRAGEDEEAPAPI
jgi:hypothetical protein